MDKKIMLRFLLFCILFFLLYVGFNTLGTYDTKIIFSIIDYQVETTLLTFAIITVATTLIALILMKCIYIIFDLPTIIRNKIKNYRSEKAISRSIVAFAYCLTGYKSKAIDIIEQILLDRNHNYPEILDLILSEKDISIDEKISHLRKLLTKKNYNIYAAKMLTKIFYENGHYAEAESYAIQAFNNNDTDIEIMIFLIRIYAKLSKWSKFVFVVSKLTRTKIELTKEIKDEVASYYCTAAKSAIAEEDSSEAVKYLESALTLKPDYIEALNLYTEIKIANKSTTEALQILRNAYRLTPCFEIAELIISSSPNSPEVIYSNLTNLVQQKGYPGLYLAIAAYLGLTDKINEIKLKCLS